jgi:hypothetical protein
MTRLRYLELCAAGPEITKADRERLAKFVPMPSPLQLAVHLAWYGRGWRWPVRKA